MRTTQTPRRLRLAVPLGVVLLAGATVSGCTAPSAPENSGAADCVALLRFDGHGYVGAGELRRTPPTTGRTLPAVMPGCDDTGGQEPVPADEEVRVEELTGVDPATAVLFDGSIFVREGRQLPPTTRVWFRSPRCATPGEFDLTARWTAVTGPRKPRFDGDLRPPYRLTLQVLDGPAAYVGTTVDVRATTATDPTLTKRDVERALWRDGRVVATVHCAGGRFEAAGLRTLPAG